MSEPADNESKTEEPSEKKIADAINKGNVPISREVAVLASILSMLIVIHFVLFNSGVELAGILAHFIDNPGEWRLDQPNSAAALLMAIGRDTLLSLLPVYLILLVGGVAASLIQQTPAISAERIKPDLARLSLGKGFKRVLGAQGWVEFAKAIFKLAAVSVIVAVFLSSQTGKFLTIPLQSPLLLPASMSSLASRLLSAVAVAATVVAGADFVWSRRYWYTNLKMTRQEVKDERKELDGDPIVKAKRISLARDRLRRRMMAAVPTATVVVANPTHYSVALRYRNGEDIAPVVVAKGLDLVALKIREIAEDHQIPIIENKLLARSLYEKVEVDQFIPEEFYRAVAEIIHYITRHQ